MELNKKDFIISKKQSQIKIVHLHLKDKKMENNRNNVQESKATKSGQSEKNGNSTGGSKKTSNGKGSGKSGSNPKRK